MNGGYEYPREAVQACAGILIDIIDVSKPSAAAYNAAGLRERICDGFDFVIKRCKVSRMAGDAAYELVYPLAALADETLLNISECRGKWSKDPLQLRYFGEIAAGTKFFAKLDALVGRVDMDDVLAGRADWKIDVLELYFLCLASGFRGMYYSDNSRALRNVFENLGIILMDIRSKSAAARASLERLDKNKNRPIWARAVKWGLAASFFALAAAAAAYTAAAADLSGFLDNF